MGFKMGMKKKLCGFLAMAVFFSSMTVNVYAGTLDQNGIDNIGVDITWYDFGKEYTSYHLQDDFDSGFYPLFLTNDTTNLSQTAYVNGEGEVLLSPENYDESTSFSGTNEETITVLKKGNQYICMNSAGIKEIDGNLYSHIESFRTGYATVTLKSNAHKGIIDNNGKLIFEDKEGKYTELEYIGNGLFSAKITDGLYDLLDTEGKALTNSKYAYISSVSEETIGVCKDGKYGFLNLSGATIIPLTYDHVASFHEGLAAVFKDNKWGYIDKSGKEVISPLYDSTWSFNNGFAIVSLNNKWGVIDKTGKIVLPIEYSRVVENQQKQGFFDAQKDNQAFLMNSLGEVVSTMGYSDYEMETSNRIHVGKTIGNLSVNGYLDKDENLLTGFKDFNLRYLSDNLYLGVKSGEYPPEATPPNDYEQRMALFDAKGNNLTGFKYSNTGDFLNDFQVVCKNYYEQVGLVNKYGAEVLPTVFSNIFLTKDGYAFVQITDQHTGKGKVGYFKIPDQFSEVRGVKPITVYVNGIELYFDPEPVTKNESTMVPMRKIFETLGADVKWDNTTRTATATLKGKEVKVSIGSKAGYVNDSKIQLETAPFIQDDVTFVPLRFISENLGADVKWDGEAKRVIITL